MALKRIVTDRAYEAEDDSLFQMKKLAQSVKYVFRTPQDTLVWAGDPAEERGFSVTRLPCNFV